MRGCSDAWLCCGLRVDIQAVCVCAGGEGVTYTVYNLVCQ